MTRISVVMPAHNRADSIGRAIESVLGQTHPDVELIVVDDGSTDGTRETVARYGDRVILLGDGANHGSNWARNRGLERATGEVVSFIDSDDEFLPEKLATVSELFEARPEIDALVDSFELRYPPDRGKRPVPRRNPRIENPDEFRRAVFGRRLYKATPAISARRRALLDVGMFDESLKRRQDMDLLLRLCVKHRCVSTDRVLWIKHWTRSSISSKRHTFLPAAIEVCERHPDYLSEPSYRRGLERDMGRHFWRLIAAGEFGNLVQDLRRFRAWGALGARPWRLMLRYLAQRAQRLIAAG
jgi:glycosyltransferase involved in cell wall biosynthesis